MSQTTTAAGITLPCPMCGEAEASIGLDLSTKTFGCCECGTDFELEDLRAILARWAKVLAWVDAMPGA